MDFVTYLEKLGVGFSDSQKQQQFLTKMQTYICQYSNIAFSQAMEIAFAIRIGLPYTPKYDFLNNLIQGFQNAWIYVERVKLYEHKLAVIVTLVNYIRCCSEQDGKKVFDFLCYSLVSSHVLYQVYEDEDGVFIFPKGDEMLDKAEVLEPLSSLDKYPAAKNAFTKALRLYHDSDDSTTSDVADSFRKALETFFQDFFGGSKSLENYKTTYGSYMKQQGVPTELSNNFETLLKSYTNFINSYAKHKDSTPVTVLEYIMYQTGNIIRLLTTLKANEIPTKNLDPFNTHIL